MTTSDTNPLLQPWDGPFGLPPFADVRAEHFEPAFAVAMREHLAEVEAIGNAAAAPSFDNTIAALDRAGRLFDRIGGLFHNLASSETSPPLQEVERRMAPRLAAHDSALYMNRPLFERIRALHERRGDLALTSEQQRVLERYHTDFIRAGARLDAAAQARHAELMQRLADLTTRFGQNVLADESGFRLLLRSEADFAGLPDFVRTAARQAASERGIADAGLVTLSRSHIVPFLTFSERRDLREAAWRAWVTRGEHAGESDNREIAAEILALRLERAHLHGYASYADFVLADTMAGSQEAVSSLLMQVWAPARRRALAEREALEVIARGDGSPDSGPGGGPGPIESWDWRFYAEKVRQQRYALDEAQIKPYFALERVAEAAFECARRLFGIRLLPRPEIAAYHPDVKVYEVQGEDGQAVGVFLHDNLARPSKRSGAWMSAYRTQSRNGAEGGGRVLPIIVNNCNFARGAPGEPTLLGLDDATTLFHEFGHGLHGLLSDVTYERVAGTSVLRDFVELPSQLFEHWLEEPEVLKRHARHYRTGEPIPDALIARMKAARHFNQGYETVRYVASALVDMAAHARSDAAVSDVVAFERSVLEGIGLPEGVGINHRLTHFQHLFAGSGYAAGYYVYLWAEVLDADGFEAFVQASNPFDGEVARRLLRHIYSSGNSVEPGAAYRAFRGKAATPQPMLRQRGLLEEEVTAG